MKTGNREIDPVVLMMGGPKEVSAYMRQEGRPLWYLIPALATVMNHFGWTFKGSSSGYDVWFEFQYSFDDPQGHYKDQIVTDQYFSTLDCTVAMGRCGVPRFLFNTCGVIGGCARHAVRTFRMSVPYDGRSLTNVLRRLEVEAYSIDTTELLTCVLFGACRESLPPVHRPWWAEHDEA